MRMVIPLLAAALAAPSFAAAPAAGVAPALTLEVSRPAVQSLVLTLDDGTVITLSGAQLGGEQGGFLVWNSFGVTQIAMAYLASRGDNTLSPDAIWAAWSPTVDAEGPVAFLVTGGNLTPLGAAAPGTRTQRAKLAGLTVTLSNGRSRSMPLKMLEDSINGVLAWGDATIRSTLVPFYDSRPWLRSSSSTVLARWNTLDATTGDLPATMSKPLCDPEGWP
jgi:hypothetical protein